MMLAVHKLIESIKSCRRLLPIQFVKLNYPIVCSNYRTFSRTMFEYPTVNRDKDGIFLTHGVKVYDAYRWLEDADSPETKNFVDEQNKVSMPYINSCADRNQILTRLKELYEYARYGCPYKRGDNYYMSKNSGLQNQSVMYIIRNDLNSTPEVFIDPNTLSDDGTVSLSYSNKFSHDGKLYAYGLSKSGSDWITIKVKNTDTLQDLSDVIEKVKFSSISWTRDNKGFFYSGYLQQNDQCDGTETTEAVFQKLYYHRIGTKQCDDILVYENTEQPYYRFSSEVSDCGLYLHVFTRKSCEFNLWHFHKFDDPLNPKICGKLELKPFIENFDADYDYVTNDGPVHYLKTNKDAPNFRLVVVDLSSSESLKQTNWRDLIPNHSKDVLEYACVVRIDVLVCNFTRDVVSVIELRKLSDGSLIRNLNIPVGAITTVNCERDQDDLFFGFTSYLSPGTIYHMKVDSQLKNEPLIFKEVKPKNFDASKFEIKQIFYTSKDGTKVPMFIIHKKDFRQDGDAPCLLYGYGGFKISLLPCFSVQRLVFMDNLNGVLAIANIRGGGEYGKMWHNGGKLLNKQNCFDDFASAGEYLVKEQYTSSKKLVIEGGSNGGLLVGATANQRPDLFGCVISHVGVMDMLRFHKFTIGNAWISDYGNPDEEEHFRNLIRFSPLHNIPDSSNITGYPATLVLTADHDDRVVPLHSFKFISELQHKLGKAFPHTPLMIRVDTKAGHGFGKPTEKIIEEVADIYCFIIKSLNLSYK